ncbi:MAG: tetratricopeptide repeat protein [Anaerolineae bacterium]|nr:tetratricopeptide repeat protein [Anaerolineae bacterium]
MGKVRSLAPENCPHCQAPRSLFVDVDRRLTCRLCGYKVRPLRSLRPQAAAPEDAAPEDAAPLSPAPIFKLRPVRAAPEDSAAAAGRVPRRLPTIITDGISHSEPLSAWAQAKYSTGLQYTRQGDYAAAITAFRQALDEDRDFVDAHLWIARLTEDPAVRREHLGEVLAQQPTHLEAVRELMLLNGQLSPEEAARAASPQHDPALVNPGVPVQVTVQALRCPVCSGSMTTLPGGTQSRCDYCGHTQTIQAAEDYGLKSLTMALMQRRGQAVVWQVGAHCLRCQSCGAERTLPPERLTQRCPFCGSQAVIEQDALQSFQQPDGVVPFSLSAAAAETALDDALNSGFERLKGLFSSNQVERLALEGVYVPCWLFDTVIQVNRTITEKTGSGGVLGLDAPRIVHRRETLTEMANDVPVYAVQAPPPALLERLGAYRLSRVVPYTPELLHSHTALLYTLDFDRASLLARDHIGAALRGEYGTSFNADQQVSVQPFIQQMLFRLVLLPVWVATITESDGDLRPCLIHGQTGRVALGKARRP